MKVKGKRRTIWWVVSDRCAGVWPSGDGGSWNRAAAELPDAGGAQKVTSSRACWPPVSWMPLRKVDVGAQVSGQLKTLHVNIGDKVKKGPVAGVIDPEQAQNQIKEVEATLMELRAQLNQGARRANWRR